MTAEATEAGLSDTDFLQEGVLQDRSDEEHGVAAGEGDARQAVQRSEQLSLGAAALG